MRLRNYPRKIGSVQLSSVPRQIWSSGGHEGQLSRDPLPVFSAGSHREPFWHVRGCPLFDNVQPAFSLPTTASPTLQGALKNGFGETVVACVCPNHSLKKKTCQTGSSFTGLVSQRLDISHTVNRDSDSREKHRSSNH